jgi:ectoine hydroxylase-related dioxygenase (phytanoyl-CoA dioxygenase family)
MTSWIDPGFCYGADDHREYCEMGYRLFDSFLLPEAVVHCQAETDRMLGQLQPGRSPEDMISCHHQEPWIFRLASEPKLLDMIERQVGPNIVLWSSHFLIKPPRTGKLVPWHQDTPYWDLDGQLAGGVWIAFDDVDRENGTMSVLPGWHNKGELPRRDSGGMAFSEEIQPEALPADLETLRVEYRLRAGQMAIHDTMMPHTSTPNSSDRYRRVLVLRYMAADGTIGAKEYEDYRTGEKFLRKCFLMRGEDVANYGLRPSPF